MRMIDADSVFEAISYYIGQKIYASYPNDKMPDFDKGMIDGYARARSIVFETPTVAPVGRWIPCEERMPEEPFGCLVTVMDTEPMTGDDFENILPYFVGWDGEQWNDYDGYQCPFEVLAWMPLPEPYKMDEVK